MTCEALFILEYACVIDNQGVVNTVLGVVNIFWLIGIDNLDEIPVGNNRAVFFIDRDMPIEWSMYRIATQQTGPFAQVTVASTTHHDGFEPKRVTGRGTFDHQARQDATDTAEAIQHDIARLIQNAGAVRYSSKLGA